MHSLQPLKMSESPQPFWQQKPLEQLSAKEWESLCDGCGVCCLNKLEDEDSGEIYLTNVACDLLDTCNARCSDYNDRFSLAPDCTLITPEVARTAAWLPSSCAYRLLAHNQPLPSWHPLISGNPDTVSQLGLSIRNKVIHENEVGDREYAEFIIDEAELTPTQSPV